MSLARSAVSLHVSPSVRKALGELATLLEDYHYSQHAREAICAYVAREGTLTGAPGLDDDDEADASMVFEAELEPLPFDSEAWDRDQGVIFDAELLALGTHPWPMPTVGDDDRTEPPVNFLPPISGGAPDDEPAFTPTASDWEDYRNHFDQVEALYGYE